MIAVTLIPLWQYGKTGSRLALRSFEVISVTWWILVVGIFEGLWRHTLPGILYLTGIPRSTLVNLMMVDGATAGNLLFELTGVLEFVLFLPVAYYSSTV